MTFELATTNQRAFIGKLVAQGRGTVTAAEPLTKRDASAIIERLLATLPPAAPDPVTEPGIYRTADARLFKVQRSKESGNLYAKELVAIGGDRLTENGETVQWEFRYAAGAIYRLTATERVTLEQAKAFGIQYGVCCVCGALLKDAKSVAAGIGPVCAKRI
jgi:hypothetical protein